MRRYLLLDSNIVAGYFMPESLRSLVAQERIHALIEAVRKRAVEDYQLLLPDICIPEVLSVFAKHAYGRYNQQVKRTVDIRRYWSARGRFSEYIHDGAVLHQYEVNRYQILATDLIAPIDHRFRIRKTGQYQPMAALDHLIVAMGVVLVRLHGHDAVAILTADRRMADAVSRASNLNPTTADSMRLPKRAAELGYTWESAVFPTVLHLPSAGVQRLRSVLGLWPLPNRAPAGILPRAQPLPRRRT